MRQLVTQQNDQHVIHSLYCHIAKVSTGFLAFEEGVNANGIVTVKAQFDSWDEADRVHRSLSDGTFPRSKNIKESMFWLHLPAPMCYTITIPVAQYSAQKQQWRSLLESIRDTDACNLVVDKRAGEVVRVRLLGKVKAAVGALKVRIESLAAGEKIEGWHPSFGYSNNQFVQSLASETGGFLRADYRRKVLKAYGKPAVVAAIRAMVETELQKLASREWSAALQRRSVGFFIRQGIPALREIFGNENVLFNAASRLITVRGEEARHTLKSFIDQSVEEARISVAASASTDHICPVCYDSVTNPLVLGCKHVYCMPCMHHLLTSTEEADKFPLTCVGEEGRCGMPIPIPVVQRFLTPADFAHLLEVAFTSYVTKHPRSLKYCKTPDCTQIYRASKARPGTNCAIKCPSCFSSICSSCHEDDHEGMSCRDVRVAKNNERLSEAWVQRLKRCPRCQVPIEKSGGCNHISCRCGAHVCWKCMGVFNADVIYEHMNAVHGGIDDDQMMQNVPERVHYDEQERVLQQAREEHQRAAPRARVALLQAYEEIWRTAHRVERDRDLRVLQEDREAWEMEQPQQGMADARLEDRRRAQELRPRVQIFR